MNIQTALVSSGFPAPSARIYVRLLEVKRASARELAEHLGMTRPSVYDNLKFLIEQGVVTELDEDNKKVFHIDDTRTVSRYIDEHVETLAAQKKFLEQALPRFSGTEAKAPSIRAYAGIEGIKKILREMLWYRNIETCTVWPANDMAGVLGDDFLSDLNRKRIQRGISIRSIWPAEDLTSLRRYPFLGVGGGHLRERRIAPKGMKWKMSYWQYADKVAFISSHKESFGFVVESRDLVSLMKVSFDALWEISKETKPQPQHTDVFLETV